MKLCEKTNWQGCSIEDGLIKNVKILGENSRNKRHYPIETRKNAHNLLEGARVSLNHEGRTVESRIGRIVNVKHNPDGSYGDFEFLEPFHRPRGNLLSLFDQNLTKSGVRLAAVGNAHVTSVFGDGGRIVAFTVILLAQLFANLRFIRVFA